jgi:hypothetical protein
MNKTVKKKVKFINYFKTKDYLPHAKLYPSTGLAQFHGTIFGFLATLQFSQLFLDFQLSWPEYK